LSGPTVSRATGVVRANGVQGDRKGRPYHPVVVGATLAVALVASRSPNGRRTLTLVYIHEEKAY